MFGFEDFIVEGGFKETASDFFDHLFNSHDDISLDEKVDSDDDFEDPFGEPRSTQVELPGRSSVEGVLKGLSEMFEIIDYKVITLASGAVMLVIWYRRKKGVKYPEKGSYDFA